MSEGLASPAPVIELAGFTVELAGRPILNDLDVALTGRAIGLLGPNGAGKTTLLRTLLGFYPVARGSARVLGRTLEEAGKEVRGEIGYMPESDAHIAKLTAVRFVRLMAELSGLPPDAALERAHEALFYVGLGEARYRRLHTFSTGMKQMAKLAQALVHGPRLLMLDEPTNGLDPPGRKRMLDLIRDIRDRGDTTVLLSSHLLGDVEAVCDEVVILKGGRIAARRDLAAERRGNRSFVEVELDRTSDEFVDALVHRGWEVAAPDPLRVKVVLPPQATARDLLQIARDHQVVIRRLDCKRNSLQDIFLEVMEDDRGGV